MQVLQNELFKSKRIDSKEFVDHLIAVLISIKLGSIVEDHKLVFSYEVVNLFFRGTLSLVSVTSGDIKMHHATRYLPPVTLKCNFYEKL